MLVLILATVTVAFLFHYLVLQPLSYWKNKGVKQQSIKCTIEDNWRTLMRKQSFLEMIVSAYEPFKGSRYSGMYQIYLPTLIVNDPELIKQLAIKDFDHFTDHQQFIPPISEPMWSKNLFSLKGQTWRDMRTVLSPSFTSSKMRVIFHLISDCAENFVQHFLKKDEEVVTVEFKDIFSRFANDVIATAAFGIKVDSLGQQDNQFYLMGKEITDLSGFWTNIKFFAFALVPKLFDILKITMFSKKATEFFRGTVEDTIKMREEKGIIRPDMIHLLLEARKGIQSQEENDIIDTGFATAKDDGLGKSAKPLTKLTNLEIAAQAAIFFFAGFDTVSGIMCFVAYELTVNPDIQDRLRKEIEATFEECDGKLTYESLLKMKYMDMVVSETLRKWPNQIALDRVCTKPYTIEPVTPDEKPLTIETDTPLLIPVFGIHRDPKYYSDPERFDPERFSDENKGKIKPNTYMPFGVGPRNCIGSRFALLEIKTVMFYILQYFEFVPVQRSQIPLKLDRYQINLSAEGGFWFGLKRIRP